jgi:hypothetical protein
MSVEKMKLPKLKLKPGKKQKEWGEIVNTYRGKEKDIQKLLKRGGKLQMFGHRFHLEAKVKYVDADKNVDCVLKWQEMVVEGPVPMDFAAKGMKEGEWFDIVPAYRQMYEEAKRRAKEEGHDFTPEGGTITQWLKRKRKKGTKEDIPLPDEPALPPDPWLRRILLIKVTLQSGPGCYPKYCSKDKLQKQFVQILETGEGGSIVKWESKEPVARTFPPDRRFTANRASSRTKNL